MKERKIIHRSKTEAFLVHVPIQYLSVITDGHKMRDAVQKCCAIWQISMNTLQWLKPMCLLLSPHYLQRNLFKSVFCSRCFICLPLTKSKKKRDRNNLKAACSHPNSSADETPGEFRWNVSATIWIWVRLERIPSDQHQEAVVFVLPLLLLELHQKHYAEHHAWRKCYAISIIVTS